MRFLFQTFSCVVLSIRVHYTHYIGPGDLVQCYYCGGELKNWKSRDDPMIKHARLYPNCGHLLIVMGQPFIERVNKEKLSDILMRNQKLASGDDKQVHKLYTRPNIVQTGANKSNNNYIKKS